MAQRKDSRSKKTKYIVRKSKKTGRYEILTSKAKKKIGAVDEYKQAVAYKKIREAASQAGRATQQSTVLFGPLRVASSWVRRIAYLYSQDSNGVAVEFKNGVQVFYPDQNVQRYYDLKDAGSKGKEIWGYLYYQNYVFVNFSNSAGN